MYFSDKLRQRLQAIADFALTVIEAPLGHGKTTAVHFSLTRSKFQVLWQTVYIDGAGHFWNGFCNALTPLSADLADSLRKLGMPVDAALTQKAVELIGNVTITQETILVIDDYHIVASPAVDRFLAVLFFQRLPRVRVVVTSRTAFLPAVVGELRLKGLVNYIGTKDFLLRPEDIAGYYALCGIAITPEQRQQLFAYSEGWITPLYLSMLEYVKNRTFLPPGSIAALVHNTVYMPLRAEVKEFLTCVCLLDSFSVEQARHMWPQGDAAGLIEELTRQNTFIIKDKATGSYSFHSLLLAPLREVLAAKSAAVQNTLWERAGSWYFKTGEFVQALACFEQAGNFQMILTLLAAGKGIGLTGEHKEKIIGYFERCPESLKAQNLAAVLTFIRFMISYNESARLQEACTFFTRHIDSFAGTREQKNALLMEYEWFLTLTKYNDIREMAKHYRKALSYMDQPVCRQENTWSWTFGSPSVLLMFYRESGRLAAHVQDMKDCLPDYYRLTGGHGSGAEYVMEAEAALNQGHYETAETILYKGLYYAQANNQWSILIAATFVQIRLAFIYGDYQAAVSLKQSMSALLESNKQYMLLHTLDICETYFYLLLNMPEKAAPWIACGDYSTTRLLFPAMPALHIVYGRYLLLMGNYRKLIGMSDIFLQVSGVYPNLIGQIYAYIYIAVAYHRLGEKDAAAASLSQALAIALPDAVYLPFAENSVWLADLFKTFADKEWYRGPLKEIAALAKKNQAGVKKIMRAHFKQLRPELTARENEVAALAIAGLSNKKIADNLLISENTVKARLKVIFNKMGIKSRVQLEERLKG